MSSLTETVADFIDEFELGDKTIVVGFSGGFDSMCLLDVLSKLKKSGRYPDLRIIAAHFNHNWRGNEALKEQEVCKLFAAGLGIEFVTKTASADVKKTENDARLARYEFFEEVYEDYDADAVFTAHNKDDNAETVLYRVIKGTGIYGLKGISRKRNYFYRPLLKVSRADILKYCDDNNLSPNNDSSNSNTAYKRNYLRLSVIPALERVNKSVKDSLNTLAEVAQGEDAIIDEYMSIIRQKVYDGEALISSKYKQLSNPVRMRLIHEYVRKYDLDYDFKRIKEIVDFVNSNIDKRNGSTISLSSSKWLYVDDKIIEAIPQKTETEKEEEILKTIEMSVYDAGEYDFGGQKLILKEYEEKEIFVFPEATANFVYVDLSNIQMPMTLRTRREGDIINPFGMTGSMKLKKYLNSKGVPRHKRDKLLVLASGDEILWVVGIGLSNKIGVTKIPTHVIEVR